MVIGIVRVRVRPWGEVGTQIGRLGKKSRYDYGDERLCYVEGMLVVDQWRGWVCALMMMNNQNPLPTPKQ